MALYVNSPDRLTYRCHIIEIHGVSYRLKNAKRRFMKEPEGIIQTDSSKAL